MPGNSGRQSLTEILAEREGGARLTELLEKMGRERSLDHQGIAAFQRQARAVSERHVVDVADDQSVIARAADQAIRVGATVEDVIARTAIQPVTSFFAQETVLAPATVEPVVAAAAEQLVLTGSAQQAVVAGPAEQPVIPGAAIQEVVTRVTVDDVVAGSAEEPIVVRRAVDDVVAVGAGDGCSDAPLGLRVINVGSPPGPGSWSGPGTPSVMLISPGWIASPWLPAGAPFGGARVPPASAPAAVASAAAAWAATGSRTSPLVEANAAPLGPAVTSSGLPRWPTCADAALSSSYARRAAPPASATSPSTVARPEAASPSVSRTPIKAAVSGAPIARLSRLSRGWRPLAIRRRVAGRCACSSVRSGAYGSGDAGLGSRNGAAIM